ncbi:MAG: ABC transporter permease [bacterium]|nr:ABC transporter permease [bacterium]
MNILQIVYEAFRALDRNRIRAFLTALGIIIGVGAVVAMGAVGAGAKKQVEDQVRSLGTAVLMVFPGSGSPRGVSGGAGSGMYLLSESDAEAIEKEIPHVRATSPLLRTNAQVIAGAQNWATTIQGGDHDFLTIRAWQVVMGENFTSSDVRNQAKVALIGETVRKQLFPDSDPLGATIRIRKIPFRVIGVLEPKGQNYMGQDQDDVVLIPYTTLQRRILGQDRIWGILVGAESDRHLPQVTQDIEMLLNQRNKVPVGENAYSIRSQTEILSFASATGKVLNILLGSIAGVSLIVGGIGIMNIMLVSVAERTREIGLRMAIGARRSDIRWQFLLEASVLSLGGGFLGVFLGTAAANIISKFAGWPVLVTPQSITIAVIFAAAVGIFFGFYPAQKAAASNPIDALRYE